MSAAGAALAARGHDDQRDVMLMALGQHRDGWLARAHRAPHGLGHDRPAHHQLAQVAGIRRHNIRQRSAEHRHARRGSGPD
ncbi:MAG: hypothetical protein ACTHMA_10585 [Thermomicrobiales bacterium]